MSQVTFELVSEAQGQRWQLAIDRARLMGAASRAEAFRIVEAELWLLDLELPEHEIRRLAATLGRLRLDPARAYAHRLTGRRPARRNPTPVATPCGQALGRQESSGRAGATRARWSSPHCLVLQRA